MKENVYWEREAKKRERTFSRRRALRHQDVWA